MNFLNRYEHLSHMYPDPSDSADDTLIVSAKFHINYPKGDIFAADTSIAHCTATDFNMGLGFAFEVQKRFGHQLQLRSINVKKVVQLIRR